MGELESMGELDLAASPAQMVRALTEMEHEGHAAAEAANEQEAAEHFLPLIGLAAKFVLPKLAGMAAKKLGGMALKRVGGRLIGRVGGQLLRRVGPRLLRRVGPRLTRGVANVTRTLYRNRSTRPLIKAVPRIARTTVARLGRQMARGQRVTPQLAARTLAQQTARTLSNPRVLAQTYRRSRALDRRYHQRTRRVLGRPAGAPVRAASDGAAGVPGMPGMPGMPAMPGAPTAGLPGMPPGMSAMPPMPGMPAMPGMTPGVPGFAPSANGCSCQTAAAAPSMSMPGMPSMAMPSMSMPQPAPTCPTCGR
jgi:hypothetical protein